MRVRKKKNGARRFTEAGDVVTLIDKNDPSLVLPGEALGRFDSYRLEVGCGKGAFICATAEKNPDVGFFAMEVVRDVIIFAAEKVKAAKLQNVRFICGDAAVINSIFPPKTFDVIYINFCDPWPKTRHAKRRLTHRAFLEKFKSLLCDGGRIEFKTDNAPLFEFSIPEFEAAGFELSDVTRDLHASAFAADNVMTEYEKNFSERGVPINRLVARVSGKD